MHDNRVDVVVGSSYRYRAGSDEVHYKVLDIGNENYGVVYADGKCHRIFFGSDANRHSELI